MTVTFDAKITNEVKVAAYCRVSTKTDQQEESYDAQVNYFNDLIEKNPKWKNAGIYAERESGRETFNRDEFLRMMKDAEDRKFNILLTKSVSRFSRNAVDCVESIRKLKRVDVNVYFIEQNFYTGSQYSEIILTMLATIAEMESSSIGENVRQIHEAMNEQGTPVISACYGYTRVSGRKWEIESSEAKRVKLAFLMASNNFGLAQIAKRLNKMEEDEKTGKHWSGQIVKNMLLNEKYVGDILTNKTIKIKTRNGKKIVKNDGITDQFYIDEHHEPIVSKELYELVKEMITGGFLKLQKHAGENKELSVRVMNAANNDTLLDEVRRL